MRCSGARTVAQAAAMSVVLSCEGPLPSQAALNTLRLLALTTPTPDVLPHTSVRVTAVWYDPTPNRTIYFHWRLCPEPPSGDARDCALPDAGTDLVVETTGAVNLAPEMLTLPTGATSSDVIVYVAMCPYAPSVYDPSLMHYACASPEGIEAERRVYVHATPPLNNNPGIASVWVSDGASQVVLSPTQSQPLGQCVGTGCPAWSFGVQPAPGAAEAIPDGGVETLEASYYVTVGSVDNPRAIGNAGSTAPLSVHWTPPTGMSGTTVQLWVVLRDQRGGDTVTSGSVTLP